MSNALKVLGGIFLLSSIVCAFFIFKDYATISNGYYSSSETIINPIAIGLGIGVIAQGLLTFCMACGLAEVIDRSANIENKVLTVAHNTEVEKFKKCPKCGKLNKDNFYQRACAECGTNLDKAEIVRK